MNSDRPFRVLSIDGGGMRGLYTATYLETLCRRFNDGKVLDVGSAFDLIVGTSTGGILACGLAAGVGLDRISILYQKHGSAIFPRPIPDLDFGNLTQIVVSGLKLYNWETSRAKWAADGQAALRTALEEVLNSRTVKQTWEHRNIALCIPAVNMSNHKPWVFKTPHLAGKTRDDEYSLVDVCLATAAAPILLPLAITDVPSEDKYNVFADGGLWANNPVMVGLVEALQLASHKQAIEIMTIGTCAPPSGRAITKEGGNWGLAQWKAGLEIVETSLEAQSVGYELIAAQIAPYLDRPCKIMRLPTGGPPSGDQATYVGMDKADEMACKVLSDLGRNDGEQAHSSITRGNQKLAPIGDIFRNLKELR